MKKVLYTIILFLFCVTITNASTCNVITGTGEKIGDEVVCGTEHFYIISNDNGKLKLLSKYNLSPEYKQTAEINEVVFAEICNWPYKPGPLEVNTQLYEGNVKNYINNYKEYLQNAINDYSIDVDLPSLKDLKKIECKINDDYTYSKDITCVDSQYKDWIVNGQWWWTKSAYVTENDRVFIVSDAGKISYGGGCYFANGIRPVITISQTVLNKKEITTKTDGNGTIEITESSAPGEKVTYKIIPNEGYIVKEIKLTDNQGNVMIIKENEFVMPSSDVTIEVIFDKIVENPNTISISIIATLIFAIISAIIIAINHKKIKWINE